MPEIIWKGNQHTNSSARKDQNGRDYIPMIIVDHISAGSMGSMDNWFTSSGNSISSAHYGVAKDGRIHQYVDIRRMAWGNGATPDMYAPANKLAQVVKDRYGVNPNLYSVSIEHEGTDGTLTEAQLAASVWLHEYIRDQIVLLFGEACWFPLDPYHVIGHFQISRLKPSCPGPNFPWAILYEKMEEVDEVSKIAELEKKVEALEAELKAIKDNEKLPPPKWALEAVKVATTPNAAGETILDTDVAIEGSIDFYRQLTILYRAGLIK